MKYSLQLLQDHEKDNMKHLDTMHGQGEQRGWEKKKRALVTYISLISLIEAALLTQYYEQLRDLKRRHGLAITAEPNEVREKEIEAMRREERQESNTKRASEERRRERAEKNKEGSIYLV